MRKQRGEVALPRSFNKVVVKSRPEPRALDFDSIDFLSMETYKNKREDTTSQVMDETSNNLL